MSPNDESFLPPLEWEFVNKPISITTVNEHEHLPKGQKKILIDRDEDYNLRAVLHFEDADYGFATNRPTDAPGSVLETFEITVSDYLKYRSYALESSYVRSWQRRMDNVEQKFSGTATLGFHGLRMKTDNKNEVTHLIEWCLNGPRDQVFSRVTDRKVSKTFTRERRESKNAKFDSIEISQESSSGGVDFLIVKTSDFQFIVEKVPDKIGPNWSSNIGIEYRTTWGRIPDHAEREKILEMCSFIFGRQLLTIGHTMYDKNGSTVEAYARSPWWDLAKSFCKKPDSPPITIHSIPPSGRAEEVISQLLPKYYELREQLRLKEALMNLWVSREMPIGPNIPILAASLESIIKGWFKSRKSKSQGCYMNQASFEVLLKSEIGAIQKELDSHFKADGDKTKKIIKTMLGSNSFGPTERYRNFFKEIGLELTKLEEDALKERHKFIHGDAIFDKENWRQVSQRGRTIETLLSKVILKLLSYSGEYIDRSIAPWESKVLS